jgi:hypothetical protein
VDVVARYLAGFHGSLPLLGADDTTFRADISPRRAAPLPPFAQNFETL